MSYILDDYRWRLCGICAVVYMGWILNKVDSQRSMPGSTYIFMEDITMGKEM